MGPVHRQNLLGCRSCHQSTSGPQQYSTQPTSNISRPSPTCPAPSCPCSPAPWDLHTGQHWMPTDRFPMALQPHLQPLLQTPDQPPPPRPIHEGQFWHLSPALSSHPQRTIYEILPARTPQGPPQARAWLPTNAHSHVSPMPGDQYQWTPNSPHLLNSNSSTLPFINIPPGTSWNKILCQTTTNADPTGRLCRRILSITAVDPPLATDPAQPLPAHGPPSTPDQSPLQPC